MPPKTLTPSSSPSWTARTSTPPEPTSGITHKPIADLRGIHELHMPSAPAPARPSRPAAPPARTTPAVPAFATTRLPPATVDVGEDTGTGEKRDDAYWAAHPLTAGTHTMFAHASSIAFWSNGKVVIKLRAVDWNHAAGCAGEHHGRTIDWEMSRPDLAAKMKDGDEKAAQSYAYWRRDLVNAFTSAGFPEDAWPDGMHPWWSVITQQAPDGVIVPVMLQITLKVMAKWKQFPSVIGCVRPVSSEGLFYQAPMPMWVPPQVAESFAWRVVEQKRWGRPDGAYGIADVVQPDRQQLGKEHMGMPWYKELGR